jgi:hypothetical protein
MNTIDRLTERGTALVRRARGSVESGTSHLPQWLGAGAALSVAKTGTKVATTLVRRNPGVAIAVGVVGVGVLAYRFYRRRAEAAQTDAPRAAISGKVTRSNGTRVKVTSADKSDAKPGQSTERKPRTRKTAEDTENAQSSAE